MKLIKPLRVGLVKRSLLWGGRTLLSIGLVTAFPLSAPREIVKEDEMWEAITPLLGDQVMDSGEPKAHAELIVFGDYFAPGGLPVLRHGVRVALGPVDKSIMVTGRREWNTDDRGRVVASAPEPFARMPIDWRLAFGGPHYPENPHGLGDWPEDVVTADGRYPLPCLEYPDDILTRPDGIIAPAGLGPRDVTVPSRQRLAGTYDRYWAENHAPGLAEDASLALFQVAAHDQQFPGFIAGRESFVVEHMHPTIERQAGQLPGLRGRAFVRRAEAPERLEEIPLATDSCILFPAVDIGVLIHRGSLWVSAFDHPEIDLMLAAFEWQEHPARPIGYYQDDLARRLAPDGFHLGLDYRSLSPEGWVEPPHEKATWFKVMQPRPFVIPPSLQARIDEGKAQLAKMVPADRMAALAKPPPRDEGPTVVALRQELATLPAAAAAATRADQVTPQMARIKALTRQVVDERVGALEARARRAVASQGLDYDQMKAAAAASAPKTPQAAMAMVDAQIDEAAAVAPSGLRQKLLAAKLAPYKGIVDQITSDLATLEAQGKALIGHVMPMPPPPSAPEAARRTAETAGLLRGGGPTARGNFAGLDLSGFDFAGRDLTEADFAGCTLVGADFSGADLTRANFAGTDLTDARFGGAMLTETNLGRARLDRTNFTSAVLTKATLSEAEGSDTLFAGATLASVVAMKTRLAAPLFAGATLNRSKFLDAELDEAMFEGADIERLLLLNSSARGATFRDARLVRPTFVKSVLRGADFSGATIERLSTANNVDLAQARFDRAKMPAANLIGAELSRTSWVATNAAGALFAQAHLRDAVFNCALLSGALMMRADLVGARFDGSDCAGASFIRADLRWASLRAVSLYGADLTEARIDHAVIDGSLIDNTVLAGPNFPT